MCGFEASTPDALSLSFCGFDPGLSVPEIKFLGQPEGSCFTSVTRIVEALEGSGGREWRAKGGGMGGGKEWKGGGGWQIFDEDAFFCLTKLVTCDSRVDIWLVLAHVLDGGSVILGPDCNLSGSHPRLQLGCLQL